MERNCEHGLCYLITCTKVERIPGKDRIALIYNDKNNFRCTVSINDALVGKEFVYFEVDSMIPLNYLGDKAFLNPFFDFLKASSQKNAEYARIRARSMGEIVSMGLAIPYEKSGFKEVLEDYVKTNGEDLTSYFMLQKYEPPLACGGEQCLSFYNDLYHGKRTFTSIPTASYPLELTNKSDEDNLYALEEEELASYFDKECYATLKMDGTSITLQVRYDEENKPVFYIFGHSILSDNTHMYKYFSSTLDKDGKNVFDRMVEYKEKHGKNILLCGEFLGTKIQGNPYSISGYAFNCYKIVTYDDLLKDRNLLGLNDFEKTAKEMNIETVPIMFKGKLSEISKNFGYDSDHFDNEKFRKALYDKVESLGYENDYRTYNMEGKGKLHEGVVITSINGHSDSLKGEKDNGWSFKIKGLKYQAH